MGVKIMEGEVVEEPRGLGFGRIIYMYIATI